jgi:hypothetical protein
MNDVHLHQVPEGFVKTLKESSILELFMLQKELQTYPNDALFLEAVRVELEWRRARNHQKVHRALADKV